MRSAVVVPSQVHVSIALFGPAEPAASVCKIVPDDAVAQTFVTKALIQQVALIATALQVQKSSSSLAASSWELVTWNVWT